jgi:hypothetical protein
MPSEMTSKKGKGNGRSMRDDKQRKATATTTEKAKYRDSSLRSE